MVSFAIRLSQQDECAGHCAKLPTDTQHTAHKMGLGHDKEDVAVASGVYSRGD